MFGSFHRALRTGVTLCNLYDVGLQYHILFQEGVVVAAIYEVTAFQAGGWSFKLLTDRGAYI